MLKAPPSWGSAQTQDTGRLLHVFPGEQRGVAGARHSSALLVLRPLSSLHPNMSYLFGQCKYFIPRKFPLDFSSFYPGALVSPSPAPRRERRPNPGRPRPSERTQPLILPRTHGALITRCRLALSLADITQRGPVKSLDLKNTWGTGLVQPRRSRQGAVGAASCRLKVCPSPAGAPCQDRRVSTRRLLPGTQRPLLSVERVPSRLFYF